MTLPAPVRLYDQPGAPNPRRLAIVLAEKGMDVPREEVDLMAGAHKVPDFITKTGAAQVPALELSDGTVLTEFTAIARYLDALQPEPNLSGRDPLEAAVIEMWEARVYSGLFAAIAATFRHTNPKMAALEEQCPDWGEVNRARIDGEFRALGARLAGRQWIAADRFTIADVTAWVATDFRRIIRHHIPDGLDDLAAWMERMKARPSAAL